MVLIIVLIAVVVPAITVSTMLSSTYTKRYLERSKTPAPSTNRPTRVVPAPPNRTLPNLEPGHETLPPAGAERVEILWGGTWYPGYVIKRDGARTFIHYNGWADNWNEWVTAEKLRPPK